MLQNLKKACKNWWLLLILGILCIIASILILCTPLGGLATLSVIIWIVLILTGILGIIFVISNRKEIPAWGWDLILPILTIIAGIILACNPRAEVVLIGVFCAVGVLFKSIEAICYSISMSSIKGTGWGWILAAGIIGLLLSFYLFANMFFTLVAVSIFVGIALLFMGIEAIAMSVQMSKMKGKIEDVEETIASIKK